MCADDSDQAKKTAEVVEKSEELVTQLTVALRLKSGEANARHFGQIYPLLVVPSIFLIGVDGTPVEIIAGDLTSESFPEKLNKANDLHKERIRATAESSSQGSSAQPEGASASASGTSASPNASPEPVPVEDRQQYVASKLEAVRAKKAAEQEQKERNDEVNRREMVKQQKFVCTWCNAMRLFIYANAVRVCGVGCRARRCKRRSGSVKRPSSKNWLQNETKRNAKRPKPDVE